MKSQYNDEKLLQEMYARLGNGRLIAEELGLGRAMVYRWLKKYKITNRDLRRRTVDINYFQDIDNEEKAYYLGLIMADGCVYKGSSPNSYCMQINVQKKDENELKKFRDCLKADYDFLSYDVFLKQTNKTYPAVGLKISNTQFCHHLMNLGVVPRKSLKCKMPNLDKELISHFIRGYFDGNGCISKSCGRWSIEIAGGIDLLTSFQDFLIEHDISNGIYSLSRTKMVHLCTGSHKMIYKFWKLIYKNAKDKYERKDSLFHDFVSEYLSCHPEMDDTHQANCGESLRV